jgi:diguanylate cyclase (GGDEF)-like protein/PAS domain S-box-containing protein
MPTSHPDYRRLAELSSDAYVRVLFGEGMTHVSPGFERLTGYRAEDVLYRQGFFEQVIYPAGRRDFQAVLERLRSRQSSSSSMVVQLIGNHGRSVWVEMFIISVADDEGRVIGFDACARDVSEHLQIADLLSRRSQQQAVLLQVQGELLTQLDQEEALQLIVRRTQDLLQATSCTLFLLEGDEETLRPLASAGEDAEKMMALRPKVGEGLTGWVVEHRTHQRAEFPGSDVRPRQVPDTAEEPCSIMAAPLFIGERVVGALLVNGEPFRFTESDLEFLVDLAQVASMAITNSRLFSEVQRLAMVDDLTGVFNRNFFNLNVGIELGRTQRLGYPIGLLIVDLDELKQINDRFGHPTGDEALRKVAKALKDSLREADWVARVGGDEFAVVLPGCPSDRLAAIGEKLRSAIRGIRIGPNESDQIRLTVSIGGASHRDLTGDPDVLVRVADEAEREAKRDGGDRVVVRSVDGDSKEAVSGG